MSSPRQHLYIVLGLVLGAIAGVAANAFVPEAGPQRAALAWITLNITDVIGKVFLRLIFMIVVPLVFAALVLGAVEMGDIRKLGRVGIRTLGLTLVLSTIAVALGIGLVNALKPGERLSQNQREELRQQYASDAERTLQKARQAKTIRDTLLDIIPENPLQEMIGALDGSSKGNGMLSVMFFALIFGVALTLIPAERSGPLVAILQAVFDACMVIIGFAMRLAPLAVACLVFSVTARLGGEVLLTLVWFAATALAGMLIHLLVVFPVALIVFARTSPLRFFRDIRDVVVTAFATSSSNATLPTSLKTAQEELRLPREIAHFVLTVGATGNQNGTALYEGVVVLFLAQVFGVDLTVGQQVTVVLMSILAGVGTAGVPGGSLPLIAVLLTTVGVPAEGIAIILGIDRILDMVRTVLNVVGDLVIATCVARGEGLRE